DSYFIQGYAPDIALTRTSTIMQGGKRCDFRYARQSTPENGDA
ncbi:MAG: L-2-amino-thiazoline-4-carboxylic acid hydrolase, partial [Burkholderia sp.]|nr:L-2-amino-thiazoline-4-carboxylic acid hydrolase [Burkholderia sp.]